MSISSTTTCVRSLLASPAVGDRARFAPIIEALGQRWTERSLKTGELDHNNPYTLGQLLPVLRRMSAGAPALLPDAIAALREAAGNPGVSLGGFPPNGFLTWWALVALESWGERDSQQCAPSLDWSAGELYRQLSLFTAQDDEADAYQLGYNLLIQRRFRRETTRDSVVAAALRALFAAQLETGIWEKKEPLLNYGASGDAYPFAFELLNALLREFQDAQTLLAEHEPALDRAVSWAQRNAYRVDVSLWRSGNLADNKEPESWATAEVYLFLQNYRTYLAGRILSLVMRETGRGHPARRPNPGSFTKLYQPSVELDGASGVLVGELLGERMLAPLQIASSAEQPYSLARNPRRKNLVRSGIFFGPPGTGKTTYAKAVAGYLGWPLLTITPADFAAEGLLLIPTVTRRLFDQLIELEDVVIFFDEMEELMRDRDGGGTFEQRFLTTSFLPALQDLRDNARCVYLVATNNVKAIDMAARAPRRFDFQIQIRPPCVEEKRRMLKCDYPDAYNAETLEEFSRVEVQKKIEWATLRETGDVFQRIVGGASARDALQTLTPALNGQIETLVKEAQEHNSFARVA